MWNLKKIPKIAHFYFGGQKLEYLRFLSISTFIKLNPDWEINFYFPSITTLGVTWQTNEQKHSVKTDYTENLKKLPIRIKEVDFEELGINNNISEVHKSDFLRLYLLSTQGGLWSDTDILYYRPMNNLEINKEENKDVDTVFCLNQNPFYHYIGFLLSSEKNCAFKKLYDLSKEYFNKEEYQSIGTRLYSKIYPTISSIKEEFEFLNPIDIPKSCVYPYSSKEIKKIYSSNNTDVIDDYTVGIHWFGGHPVTGAFLEETDGGLHYCENDFLGEIIKKSTP